MRAFAILAVALVLAGCLEKPAPTPAPTANEPQEGRTARPGDRRGGADGDEDEQPVRELGRASGGQAMPGRIPFTVTIPEAGAEEVEWGLVVEPIGAGSDLVEGPGCEFPGYSLTVVGSYTETSGSCADLGPGEHEFVIVLEEPVLGYDAKVVGFLVASSAATEGSSSNATEP